MVTLRSKRIVGEVSSDEPPHKIAPIADACEPEDTDIHLPPSFARCREIALLRDAFTENRSAESPFPMQPNRVDACCCVQCECDGTTANHRHHRVVVVDTETTGVSRGDQIIEIAAVEVIGNRRTGRHFHAHVRPTCRIHPMASRVHGYKNDSETLHNARSIFEIFPDFVAFVAESPIVCHNVAFDMRFLQREAERVGRPFAPKRTFCTFRLFQAHFKKTLKARRFTANLDNACAFFALEGRRKAVAKGEKVYHSAMEDAQLTAGVYGMLHRIGIVHLCPPKAEA